MSKIMHDMEMDDEDQLDMAIPSIPTPPKYPWGLRISFDEKVMEKCDIDPEDACVDGIFHLHALARITSVSKDVTDRGTRWRVEAQIESMAVEGEDEENED